MAKRKVKIPDDIVNSGEHDSDCYAQYYGATRRVVKRKADKYFRNYPSMGYCTRYSVPIQKHEKGYWFCAISRWHSCD